MRLIPLTQGKFAQVDDADFDWLSQWKWFAAWDGYNWYAHRNETLENGKQRTVAMHRELLPLPAGKKVDHRDGNGLNNQRDNLRPASGVQNCRNAKKPRWSRTPTSAFKGVGLHRGQWRARVGQKEVGRFDSEIDAAIARDSAAKKLFGEFARLNFPATKGGCGS